jgi:tetratricopeptide (TPR) repeat protein
LESQDDPSPNGLKSRPIERPLRPASALQRSLCEGEIDGHGGLRQIAGPPAGRQDLLQPRRRAGEASHEESLADFSAARGLNSSDASSYFNRGLALHKLGKTAQGIQDLTECLRWTQGTGVPLNRGLLYLAIGLTDKAIADFDVALG